MLHFVTNNGFDFFGFQFVCIQPLPGASARPAIENAKVPGIAEDSLLFTVQQLVGGHDLVNIGSGGINTMNQAQCVIDTNVHLHTEVPFLTLSGLVHFWRPDDSVALASTALGGVRRRDNGYINNVAFAQHQAVFLQVLVHLFEQHLAKTKLVQEMT